MRTRFDDGAARQDQNLVGVGDGAEAMSYDEHGPAVAQGVECVFDFLFRLRVEGRGGFVEEGDLGVFENGARDRDALTLTTGEAHAPLADFGFVTIREGLDAVMDRGGAAGVVDLLVCGVLVGVAKIVHDGLVEHVCVLRDDTHERPQRVDCDVLHVLAIDFDLAQIRIVIAEEHAEDCGFAASRLADQCGRGSWLASKAKGIQCWPPLIVTKCDIVEDDVDRVGFVRDARLFFEQFQHTLGIDEGVLDRSIESSEEVERRLQLCHVSDELDKLAY